MAEPDIQELCRIYANQRLKEWVKKMDQIINDQEMRPEEKSNNKVILRKY